MIVPGFVFFPLLFLLFSKAGAAVIVTYRGDSPNLFNLEFPYLTDAQFDINADGVSDFRFTGGSFVAGLLVYGQNQFIATLSTGFDLGGEVILLPAGSIIGENPPSLGDWHRHTDNRGTTGFGLSLAQYADGYLGVSFEAADGIHYGWIKYTGLGVAEFPHLDENGNIVGFHVSYDFIPGGLIDAWAFESEPGKPILAGVVPEPAMSFLLCVGFITAWCRRTR